MTPQKISVKDKRFLQIEWDDGNQSLIALSTLRKNCPCANCLAEKDKKPSTYIPLLSSVQLTLANIKVIGNYAIQLFWQDRHDSGIYTYEKLKNWNGK